MTRLAPALLLLLAACSHFKQPEGPATAMPINQACHSDQVRDLIGQARSDALGESARQRAGAKTLRWIPNGVMVTMEYRADRLNLRLGPDGRITAVSCG